MLIFCFMGFVIHSLRLDYFFLFVSILFFASYSIKGRMRFTEQFLKRILEYIKSFCE